MEFVLVFVNLFVFVFALLHIFGFNGIRSGPFSRHGLRNRVLLSVSQALILSLIVKWVLL